MPVKPRKSKARIALTPAEKCWLYDQPPEPGERVNPFEWLFGLVCREGQALRKKLWQEHGQAVMRWWARNFPGRRPDSWWEWAAPEPRRRVGGTGEPVPGETWPHDFHLGIPSDWHDDPEDCELFGGEPVDETDPPLFESQAAYLKRLGLLEPGELRRIGKGAMEPEAMTQILNEGWQPSTRKQWG